ncbi:MAG: Flp pilus assembly complex ATPase component TadA [Sphingobacteriia bacterium]|nr:Flp pilus assembly complex ATPase component TadA [Sphingobacteriia bacterium]
MEDFQNYPAVTLAYEYLRKYLERDDIKELVINKPGEVFVETIYGNWERYEDDNLSFENLSFFTHSIASVYDICFDQLRNPLISLSFNHNRLQVVAGRFTYNGFALALRLNKDRKFKPNELEEKTRIGHQELETENDFYDTDDKIGHLKWAIKNKKNLLLAGATGSGKTAWIKRLLAEIDLNERILTVEGVPEIEIPHPNWCRLLYPEGSDPKERMMVKEIFDATLRLRPERIIVGEIRQQNAYGFVRALTNGHPGTVATIHASDPAEAIEAVVEYYSASGDLTAAVGQSIKKRLLKNIYGVATHKRTGDVYSIDFTPTKEILNELTV